MSAPAVPQLPLPDEVARAHSARVVEHIRREIVGAGGAISLARFMDLALYAPGLGYYSAGARKLGAEGDFVTAPEISPLFGRCLARQVSEVFGRLGGGSILELGAGSGALAAEVMESLARDGALPERYLILEVSADLRERQQALLAEEVPQWLSRFSWLDRLPERPLGGVILANEVLDAMPVHRFRICTSEVQECTIGWHNDRFRWGLAAAGRRLAAAVARLQAVLPERLPDGYTSEINLALPAWVASLGSCLEAGVILFIDYGFPRHEYYHPDRSEGTLMCHYRHRAHGDPLVLVGLQDITAHVDFTALAEAAENAGLKVAGYTTQAHFLVASGLLELAAQVPDGGTRAQLALANQVKTLTLPSEMGELFKVLALGRGVAEPLVGFGLRDLRPRLGLEGAPRGAGSETWT